LAQTRIFFDNHRFYNTHIQDFDMKLKHLYAGTKYIAQVMLLCCSLISYNSLPVRAHQNDHSEFKIVIMQDQKGAAKKYRALDAYLHTQGIRIKFVGASSYTAAAKMFAHGDVDGMFSGSGVAGSMLIKEIAVPVLRPEDPQGYSTYWAVIIAPEGSPKFNQKADYFAGKKVIYCSLASSGEFFYRSLPDHDKIEHKERKAPSHGAALVGLSKGAADVAIIKNRVWDRLKQKYPTLEKVGEDYGENPNGTLIVSNHADPKLVKKLTTVLYALETAQSPEAKQARKELNVQRYLPTEQKDFAHTLKLLKLAGVGKDFVFSF
jgi:ABC-type phosphate/phosphonate transport system substrate-binding protein